MLRFIYLIEKDQCCQTILSDALCSLQENRARFAFTLDLVISKDNWLIESSSFKNTCISLRKNLRYDTDEQRGDKMFKKALNYVKKMNRQKSYIDNIMNCHDLIAYLMILMNYISATYLKKNEIGIFRSAKFNTAFVAPDTVPSNDSKFPKNVE